MIKTEISEEHKYEIWHKCIEKYGVEKQMDMLTEECGELVQAINHYKRKRNTQRDVIEELVDVYMMVEQMTFILKGYIEFNDIYRSKFQRLIRRLDEL